MIHPTSIVDDGAEIGAGCRIWHFCHVSSGAVIGRDCVLGQNVYIGEDVIVGSRVKIQNNVSVYKSVVLEDDVFCGPSMVFTNVATPRAFIERKDDFRKTTIGRGASLGANCTVVCGNRIGSYAMVGAGAVVTHDVPDFALVAGVPARQIGWVSRAGERLDLPAQGQGQAVCPRTGERYRLSLGVLTPLD